MSLEEMRNRNLRINFLYYFKIEKQINTILDTIEKQSPIYGPYIPRIIFEMGIAEKGCGRIYNKLMNYNVNLLKDIKEKWENTLKNDLVYDIIEKAFKDITHMKTGPYQKYFQYKLLHNRTITNEKLYKMNISDTNMCKNCHTEIDTIKHAFLDCHTTRSICTEVEKWTKSKISPHIKLTDIDKIFGYQSNKEIVNKILSTKLVIYSNRKEGRNHHLRMVKRLLYNDLCTEEYEAKLT